MEVLGPLDVPGVLRRFMMDLYCFLWTCVFGRFLKRALCPIYLRLNFDLRVLRILLCPVENLFYSMFLLDL
jgi:hypothetical protein